MTPTTANAAPYQGIVVVIPTRNRPDLAMNAARSVLGQKLDGVQVLVSDNSTSDDDRHQLRAHCQKLRDVRLRYVVPPAPMSMTRHWDWVLQEALESSEASHFLFLTDRMMFKPGALASIIDIVRRYPERIVSYNHDMVDDYQKPIRVRQYPGTGKVFEVNSLRLSALYSECNTHWSLPRMLNSVAPHAALEAVRDRFGSRFASIAPDFNFGFRCLEVFDSILVYDASPIFHYALHRSNGARHTRGERNPASLDFAANLPVNASSRNYATPIPQLLSVGNAIMNEYLIVKHETQSSRFFELHMQKYLDRMAEELHLMADGQARAEAEGLLRARGWKGFPPPRHESDERGFSRRLLNRVKRDLRRPFTKRLWLFLARQFGVKLPDDDRFEFHTADEAIDFMCRFQRRHSQGHDENKQVLQGVEMPAL